MRKTPFGFLLLYGLFFAGHYFASRYYPHPKLIGLLDLLALLALYLGIVQIFVFLLLDIFWAKRKQVAVPKITRDVILTILYFLVLFIVLKQKTAIDLGSLLATSAVLSFVFGLALQDTLGNFFSGIALQIEKPYNMGDWVSFDQHTGQVVGVTWKSTLIKTRNNELVYVPNNLIFKSTIKNHSRPTPEVASSIEIGAGYDDPPNKVMNALRGLMISHTGVLQDPEPTVRLTQYADFSIIYKMFFRVANFQDEPAVRLDLMSRIWYLFKREGISIPYPVQEEFLRENPNVIAERCKKEAEGDAFRLCSGIEILKSLHPDAQLKILRDSPSKIYGAGETIVRQGEEGDSFYIIKAGECDIWVATASHVPEKVATLKAGQFFGEMSLLTGEKRSATVQAITDVEVVEIKKECFSQILQASPGLLEHLGTILAERQAHLKIALGRQAQELSDKAKTTSSQFVNRIKSFFGI